jgi:uncharacterized coiled-coil DUF342 family protein
MNILLTITSFSLCIIFYYAGVYTERKAWNKLIEGDVIPSPEQSTQIRKLRAECDEAQSIVGGLNAQLDVLSAENKKLHTELADLKTEYDELKFELSNLRNEYIEYRDRH